MRTLDKFKRRRMLMACNTSTTPKEPVTYDIYNQGTTVNYGTFATSNSGESSGALITTKDPTTYGLQAYSGSASGSSGGIILLPTKWTGSGQWTISITDITEPGTLYITAYRDTYSGSSYGTTSYEQKFSIIDSDGSTVMTQTPSTSSYTYSCSLTNVSSGFTITGWVSGTDITDSIHMYVTVIQYITSVDTGAGNDNSGNTGVTTTPGTVLYGDGNTAEGEVWKQDSLYGSVLEQDGILQLLDNASSGHPWVTFLDKGRDIGFDFTDYSKLCIQTTRVTHGNEAAKVYCFVSYSATNEQGLGDGYLWLTAHETGIVTDVVDISAVTSTNYIHIKGDDRVWISRVWLE
ncbi:hypothetical protein [Intestinibacter sp.]|uniref:hypothetical protein n=1 Tax=Intestinibacter sp. TaxID=1965304 RepID=UPI003F14BFFB